MNKYLIVFRHEVNTDLLLGYHAKDIQTFDTMPEIATCKLDANYASALSAHSEILSVEADDITTFDAQTKSYAFDLMEVQKFHDIGITGKGIKVAILDTGVQRHEDLIIKGGFNAYDSKIPYDKDLVNNHGTRVAGIIAMQDNDKGGVGIAPGVELYAVRIDNGNGSLNRTDFTTQIKAIDWCIANKMDAINCSFSSSTDSTARKLAFKRAYDAGIAIFCSAGNYQTSGDDTSETMVYPSKYPFVITVANVTENKTRYVTSSVGKRLNFSSGGTLIYSTHTDSGKEVSANYNSGTGTSYATPAVLGMYCLYKEMYKEDRDRTLERMYLNAERLGSLKEYGAGIPKFPTDDYENIQVWR